MRYSLIRRQLIFIQSLSICLGVVSLYLCVLGVQLCLAMVLVNLYFLLTLTEVCLPSTLANLPSFTESNKVYYKRK